MLFSDLGQSVLGETLPSVWVVKTSGTVSPNMDLPAGEEHILIPSNLS